MVPSRSRTCPLTCRKWIVISLSFRGIKCTVPPVSEYYTARKNGSSEIPPFQGGGDMVDVVTFEKTTYNQLPYKFEAGTTNFVGSHWYGQGG